MFPPRFAPILQEMEPLAALFREAGHRLFLVGGSVRDLFIGESDAGTDLSLIDFDATTTATPDQIKKIVNPIADALWTQGERFGTIGLKIGERTYEITTHRAEAYSPDSRKPEVQFATDIETDLSRRDFTINAMALELTTDTPVLVDPFGGLADLMARVLRTPLSAEESFSDDPLRMLRAARFISQLEVAPDPSITAAVTAMADRLTIVSAERVRIEFDRLMTTKRPTFGLWFLVDTGLVDHFLPEMKLMRLEQDPIHRHKDVLTHTLAVVENVQLDPTREFDFRITRLAALYHDIGKPRTRGFKEGKGVTFHHHEVVGAKIARKRLTAMRYPGDVIDSVCKLTELHLRFHGYGQGQWTDSAVRRYVRDAGEELNRLHKLTRADCTTRNPRRAAILSATYDDLEERIATLAQQEELNSIRPDLDGNDIMEILNVPSGPMIGKAYNHLLNVRLDEGPLTREQAIERLTVWWNAQSKND